MSERQEALVLLVQAMLNLAILSQKVAETTPQKVKLQGLIDQLDVWLAQISPSPP